MSAVLAAALLGAGSASAADKTSTEKTLIQMENDWTKAAVANDTAALGKILADDWVGQGPTGVGTKAEVLADMKSGDFKVSSATMGEVKVRIFGDVAVVTGSNDEKSSYKGKDTSGHYIWTDVFVKRSGKWQAVASQSTLLPPKQN
jgi:ketosteroid isomerase-like protein